MSRRRRPSRIARARRGATLPTALLMLTALAALAGGSFSMSTQSFRGGRNAMVEQRAFSVAESGLNQQIGSWNRALNATPEAGGLALDSTVTASVFVANGDTARVRVTRLDPFLFAVQSVGRASIPNPDLLATRRVSAIVRIAYPSITPQAAITTNGDVTIQGNTFRVDGRDRVPFAGTGAAWDADRCLGLTGPDAYAVAVPPGAAVSAVPGNLLGALGVLYSAAAGDPNTYLAFGTETMNSLIQNADRRYVGGNGHATIAVGAGGVGPSTNPDGTCDVGDQGNWGEPLGGGGVAACRSYFPIVHVAGSADVQGTVRGQGILIVDGDLKVSGDFTWLGLVLVRHDVTRGNGSATITGAVMAANVDVQQGSVFGGGQAVHYSRCAVESALRGSAVLVRVRDRAWAQLF